MKPCKGCRHWRPDRNRSRGMDMCDRPGEPDRVSGGTHPLGALAAVERQGNWINAVINGQCGAAARFFEPRAKGGDA